MVSQTAHSIADAPMEDPSHRSADYHCSVVEGEVRSVVTFGEWVEALSSPRRNSLEVADDVFETVNPETSSSRVNI